MGRNAHSFGIDPKGDSTLAESGAQVDGRRTIRSRLSERLEDFRPDFITVPADRRAEMDIHIGRISTEPGGHGFDATFQHSFGRPAPPRMHRGHGPLGSVHDEHRHTVRDRHAEQDSRFPSHVSVACADDRESGSGPTMHPHLRAMHLPGVHDARRTGCHPELFPVDEYLRLGSPSAEQSEIEGTASPAASCRPLYEPRELVEPPRVHERGWARDGDLPNAGE